MNPEPADTTTPVTTTPAADGTTGGIAPSAAGPAAGSGADGGRSGTGAGEHASPALRVAAEGLTLRGARGPVFQDVSFSVPAGELAVISGVAGTGRTSLLLTLGGRMKPTSGTATVGDLELPGRLRAVQRVTSLGVVANVTDLDPTLTVREHLSEALDLREGLFGRWRGRGDRIRRALERVGLDVDPGTFAQDLLPDETQLLGAAIGLTGAPGVLLLDDVDEGLPPARQRALWERLRAVADSGVTVLATCHDPEPAEGLARHVLTLPDPRDALLEETSR
ncbi:ATP-binding cassette domain-containing protein [Actinomadura kijaniata]|uniref:ATP-binding cassette domain-containing protein n=1 Tax=Actinomadura kijaniata TaxID=46161 RepID=UPI000A0768CC|nr:ATP-binding cassette domain-containing protein [Actinomadura kijaniata]